MTESAPKQRMCKQCGQLKLMTEFDKHGRYGRAKTCKACRAAKKAVKKSKKPRLTMPVVVENNAMRDVAENAIEHIRSHYGMSDEDFKAMLYYVTRYPEAARDIEHNL